MSAREPDLSDGDYQALAGFRQALRGFTQFSEKAAEEVGLTPQQHQALLIVRAESSITIGDLAERLMLRPHSATGLADRLMRLGLVERQPSMADKRRVGLALTAKADGLLRSLSSSHRAELRRLRPMLKDLLDRL